MTIARPLNPVAALLRYPRYWLRLLRRPSSVRLHGIELLIGPKVSPEVRRQLYAERYERGEARCLLTYLAPSDVVFEVGTGIGFISALAARLIGSARVHTYEADPELLPVIRQTYERNGVAPALTHAVLGSGAGSASFYVESDLVSSSTHRRSATARQVEVPQLDVNAELGRVQPTLMIMDIEGGERELVPLIDWQARARAVCKLVIELHPNVLGPAAMAAVVDELARAGFVVDRRVSSNRKRYFSRRGVAVVPQAEEA